MGFRERTQQEGEGDLSQWNRRSANDKNKGELIREMERGTGEEGQKKEFWAGLGGSDL